MNTLTTKPNGLQKHLENAQNIAQNRKEASLYFFQNEKRGNTVAARKYSCRGP